MLRADYKTLDLYHERVPNCERWNLDSSGSIHCRGRFNGREKLLIVCRLNQESGRSCGRCCRTRCRMVIRGQHNDACGGREPSQSCLHFQSVHSRHRNVQHRHFRAVCLCIPQKCVRIQKGLDIPAVRRKKPAHRFHNRRIILDQTNGDCLFNSRRTQNESPFFRAGSPQMTLARSRESLHKLRIAGSTINGLTCPIALRSDSDGRSNIFDSRLPTNFRRQLGQRQKLQAVASARH